MKVEQKQVKDLIPYINNPRHNDAAVDAVASSIAEFGFKVPLVIDKNNVIITGHTRLKAAKKLGLETVPVVIADDLTEAQIKAFRLADNKVAEIAEWDEDLLRIELEELADLDFDMGDFGFDPFDDETEQADIVEDEPPEPPIEPQSKLGDIYQLGNHRVMCGDSTDAEMVAELMDGMKADLVFTDPPYGMKKENEGVLNDNLNYDDLLDFNRQWIPLTFGALKDNGSWYCWGTDEPLMDIYSNILKPMIKEKKITFRNLITWRKGAFGSGGGTGVGQEIQRSYFPEDEKCLFVMCGVQGFNNNQDNYFEGWEPVRQYLAGEAEKVGLTPEKLKEICGVGMWSHWFSKSQFTFITEEHYKELQDYYNNDAFKKEYDAIKKEYDAIKKEYYATRAYFDNTHDMMTNVWDFGRVRGDERTECGGHATPKPIALCARAIKTSSRENELVLDIFGGSGSTLIAAEQLNRKCYMMELDPHYVDVIVERWENFTGKKAIKLN